MNKSGQESLVTLVWIFIMLVAFVIILPPIHAIIDSAITDNNYTGMMKVFLQFFPFILILIMIASMALFAKIRSAGGL